MAISERERTAEEHETEDMEENLDDSRTAEASVTGAPPNSAGSRDAGGLGARIGLTERLANILVEEGDGDLLLQQNDRQDGVSQFIPALDLQVMGACRVDERLKPMLKLNVSGGVSEDRFLSHLSKHFEPSEVGMLARCLCIPLVSIRVGKINKQGTHLCPTETRGNLNLTLLPTSDMRILFVGDDGQTQRLSTISNGSPCSCVSVEEISVDKSGRSFLMKVQDGEVFYFWSSEKSKLLGSELLRKMKDLLERKPSLAELTGISESRLDHFATHLRAYFVASTALNSNSDALSDTVEPCHAAQSVSALSNSSRSRHCGSQAGKTNPLYQGSLGPRSSSFKEGLPRNLSLLRSTAKEKLKRRGDCQYSGIDNSSLGAPSSLDKSSSNVSGEDKQPESIGTCLFSPSILEAFGKSGGPPFIGSASQVPPICSPLFPPHYCWCPPISSTLQYAVASSQLPVSMTESLSLQPLCSLLPAATRSSSLLALPVDSADGPPLDFPASFPEPLLRLPLSMSASQQIPTFTPLICDPIVHIPVIDVCSSGGQGYLMSAGPAISTTIIPPLHQNLVSSLIPERDSSVEKGARETLRLLISGSGQSNPQLMDVLPAIMTETDQRPAGILTAGSRGLYTGATDVEVISKSIAAMGLVSLSDSSVGVVGVVKLVDQSENLAASAPPEDGGSTARSREEGIE